MIVVLTGGTGGAKLIEGLAAEIDPAELTIICNTGDDAIIHGLYVSPDIDTITYTLAGVVDPDQGWGIKGDTFNALNQLSRVGSDTWFNLGDKDLATHITRTSYLREGLKLSEVTERIRRAFGVKSRILPMSDERIETRIGTPKGEIPFQEFFVKLRCAPEVTAVHFRGVETSQPASGVLDAVGQAAAIIVGPSNPITSIGPILAVPGIRAALSESLAPTVGVSPIIGSSAVSGPAAKLMLARGLEVSSYGVAQCYADFLDTFLIAKEDQNLTNRIEALNIRTVCANIRITTLTDKRRLAREVLASAQK
jgi:LPPG:FO 2-phospho-L-lactate transferase